jgi:FG-GAP-like repeat
MNTPFRCPLFRVSTFVAALCSLGMLACHDSYEDHTWYSVSGYRTEAVAVADVEGKGHPAVVSINTIHGEGLPHPGFVTVRLQDPTRPGYFLPPLESITESDPVALSLADLSGQGGPPALVLAHRQLLADPHATGRVSVQKPDIRAGYFQAPMMLSLGTRNPSDVAAGDLNHDGLPDIAVAADGASSVAVFFQNTDGTFTAQTFGNGGVPNAVAIGDLNHDGYQDLVVANAGNTVSVLLQDAAQPGTFLPAVSYTVGTNPVSVKIAALTDPNHPDILTANFGTDTAPTTQGLTILPHDAANPGQFLASTTYDTGDFLSASVAVGNPAVTGLTAHAPFIAVANLGAPGWPGSVSVFMTDPSAAGHFLSPKLYQGAYGPSGVAVGNLGESFGGNALVTADGGTFLRFEQAGQIGVFGDLIQLYQ